MVDAAGGLRPGAPGRLALDPDDPAAGTRLPGKLLDQAVAAAQKKKPLPALEKLRLEIYDEGQAAQILHVGPYREETATIDRLHAFIKEKGYHLCGKHHEIYLSDPRRTAPEKLKTILRQPISLEPS